MQCLSLVKMLRKRRHFELRSRHYLSNYRTLFCSPRCGKEVAKLIVDDIDLAATASITELAEKANVSEATITRFAKAIGCKNVRDMKIK